MTRISTISRRTYAPVRPRTRPHAPRPPRHRVLDVRPARSKHFTPALLALALLALLFAPTASVAPEPVNEVQTSPAPSASNLLASLPSRFEPNVGQAGDGVAYTLKAKGYLASLSTSAIYFALPEGRGSETEDLKDPAGSPNREPAKRSVLTMSFVGANPNPAIQAQDPQPGVSNYFLGNDPSRWHTEVPGYSKIYYSDLYDGIDMVFYDDKGQVRYDFVVAPGADPSQIEIAFQGAENLKISDAGDLVVSSPYGDLAHKAPYTYQGENEIESSFEIRGDRAGFKLGAYDHTEELTIDPSVAYSTYLGGGGQDHSYGIAVDSTGAAYTTGRIPSTDFPTASPIQASNGGGFDAFVTKVAPGGGSLAYSSYLGGSADEWGRAIAVDSSGAAYVTGFASSTNFPTASPFQASKAGGIDAFVTKVAAGGASLAYSSYLGGSGSDLGYGIAVDSSGAAYVAGQTDSGDFPTTASPFQASKAGGIDAFVTKVAAGGASLAYSTFLGGSFDYTVAGQGDDVGRAIAVDSAGAAYVTGYTYSPDFPTASPIQASFCDSCGEADTADAFVTKVAPGGGSLAYSSFLGRYANDYGYGIAVDSAGAAYLTGHTESPSFPIVSPFTPGYYSPPEEGGPDAFVTKVAPGGGSLAYSSFLGGSGSGETVGHGIAVDSSGAAYVTGLTGDPWFLTVSPFQASLGDESSHDAFVTKVAPGGGSLVYSSFLGGSSWDRGYGIAIDSVGAAYVTGQTDSTNFPTASPFQATKAADTDTFVTKVATTISGTFTGGMWGGVSVYSKSTGTVVAYDCCITNPGETWSVTVPESSCGSGGGYAILYTPGNTGTQSRWYNDKNNYGSADCVSAPSTGISMTIPSAGVISGYVKDASIATDISGAVVYAFKSSDGTYVGSGKTGANGRYELPLSTSETYKLLVHPGASHVDQWYSGASGFSYATATAAPATANFSVTPAGVIDGYVKDASTAADLNGYPVYAYTTAGTFFAYAQTDRGYGPGRYRITVNPGESYKLKSTGGPYASQWYSGVSTFAAATATAAPFTANFSKS